MTRGDVGPKPVLNSVGPGEENGWALAAHAQLNWHRSTGKCRFPPPPSSTVYFAPLDALKFLAHIAQLLLLLFPTFRSWLTPFKRSSRRLSGLLYYVHGKRKGGGKRNVLISSFRNPVSDRRPSGQIFHFSSPGPSPPQKKTQIKMNDWRIDRGDGGRRKLPHLRYR